MVGGDATAFAEASANFLIPPLFTMTMVAVGDPEDVRAVVGADRLEVFFLDGLTPRFNAGITDGGGVSHGFEIDVDQEGGDTAEL